MHFKDINRKKDPRLMTSVEFLLHNKQLHKAAVEYCRELLAKNNKPFIKKMQHVAKYVLLELWHYRKRDEEYTDMQVYEISYDIFRNEMKLQKECGEAIKAALFVPVRRSYSPGGEYEARAIRYHFYHDIMNELLGEKDMLKTALELVEEQFGDGQGNYDFVYSTKSEHHRKHNWLINLPRGLRQQIMVAIGYRFDVDLNAANVTLLTNHAINLGLDAAKIEPLVNYMHDRTILRNHIVATYNISLDDAKTLLTSLFMGASMSTLPKFATSIHKIFDKYENGAFAAIDFKLDTKVRQFVKSARIAWSHVSKWERKHNQGKWNFRAIAGEDGKAHYVEKLERMVMDKIEQWVLMDGIKMLRIHDGFIANGRIDTAALINKIKQEIGFDVTFSEEEFNKG